MIEIIERCFKDKTRKKPWSFFCSNCNEKISTKSHTHYYRLRGSSERLANTSEIKCCSKDCAIRKIEDMMFSIFLSERYPGQHTIRVREEHYMDFKEWRRQREDKVGRVIYKST